MKRKGVSMVMTIAAIGVITILAVSISAFTLSSYKNTVYKDKRDKLKLRAESGIDYGIYELKQFINSNPDVLSYPKSKKYDLLDSEYGMGTVIDTGTDGIKLTVAISNNDDPSETYDTPSGRNLSCIKIESIAQYYSNGELSGKPVTADEWIDKINIENDYFERIFHKSSFTTASKHKGDQGCFSIDGESSLTTSGSMFLQDNVKLEDVAIDKFNMNEGEIKVKSPDNGTSTGFADTRLESPSDKIEYYKDIDNCSSNYNNSICYPGWKNKIMDTLPLCSITTLPADEDQLSGGEADSIPTDNSKIINISDTDNRPTNIYTYAVKENTGGSPIDFEMLVDGQTPPRTTNIGTKGIYGIIINSEGSSASGVEDCIAHYGRYYKLILVDGDLDINNDPTEDFNNYLIFCTGKVTFTGESHFFNCSIFANKIEFDSAKVLFDGVLTNDSKTHISSIGSDVNTDFSADKGKIYTYLTQNLDKFGDYLNFKVLKFKEN